MVLGRKLRNKQPVGIGPVRRNIRHAARIIEAMHPTRKPLRNRNRRNPIVHSSSGNGRMSNLQLDNNLRQRILKIQRHKITAAPDTSAPIIHSSSGDGRMSNLQLLDNNLTKSKILIIFRLIHFISIIIKLQGNICRAMKSYKQH